MATNNADQTATTWRVKLPWDGAYTWKVRAKDGMLSSPWSAEQTFTVAADGVPQHTALEVRAVAEGQGTSLYAKVCGQGQIHQVWIKELWNANSPIAQTYGPLQACSPEYRVAHNA